MKTNILRSVALTLGICTSGIAQAQYGAQSSGAGYGAPAQANQGYAQPGYAQPGYAPSAPAQAPHRGTTLGSGFQAYPPQATASAGARYPQQLPANQGWTQQPAPQFPGTPYRTVSDGAALTAPEQVGSGAAGVLPAPPAQAPTHLDPQALNNSAGYPAPPAEHSYAADPSNCNVGQIYNEAAAAPWIGSAPVAAYGSAPIVDAALPVRNWFAGSSLLFFDFEDDCNRRLVFDDAMPEDTILGTGQVSAGSNVGFESFIGRYFACGKYAVSASYFYFNPGEESVTEVAGMPGDYRVAMRNWDRMYMDLDGDMVADDYGVGGDASDDHLYQVYDQTAAYRIRRDVEFQGIELNFISFGIGGASRAGNADCGSCATSACGGACGLLIPACSSRMQFQVSHGLRWFQFRDEFELGTTTVADGYGSGNDDYYYNVETENNLFGYQFGSKLNYCLHRRVNLYAGGKFGIYGNNVDYYSRIGTRSTAAQVGAYYPGMQGQAVDVNRDDTVLASLGELDLGMGVRVTNCWSVTGGYRLMGVTGVATSVGSISDDPSNLEGGHLTCVNDSILLHGGYVGVQYNW